jgi:hypothetical protein
MSRNLTHRIINWVGILLILLNALAPGLSHARHSLMFGSGSTGLLDLCVTTGNGDSGSAQSASGSEGDGASLLTGSGECALCAHSPLSAAVAIDPHGDVPSPAHLRLQAPAHEETIARDRALYPPAQPRAPPLAC